MGESVRRLLTAHWSLQFDDGSHGAGQTGSAERRDCVAVHGRSSCFVLGSVPAYVNAVGGPVDALTYFVGSIFFTSASFSQLLQAQSPEMTGVDDRQQHERAER